MREKEKMTRSSSNWLIKPGSFDRLHTRKRVFASDNSLGIPDLLPTSFDIEEWRTLMSYTARDDRGLRQAEAICHFFLDDYRFESAWEWPERALNRVRRFWAALTPDFSLYTDWPQATHIWNTYRSRWTGRYWQEQGIQVIPTVNWSNTASWEFCFLGVPQGSIIAIAVPDIRQEAVRRRFTTGFEAMTAILEPRQILVYGKMPFEDERCREFETDWKRMGMIESMRGEKQQPGTEGTRWRKRHSTDAPR